MPVRGANKVRANMRRTFKDISDKKAPQFVAAVLSIGETHSKEFAPIEYGNLINSIMKDITRQGEKVKGFLSYGGGSVTYAAILELKQDWKPRPVAMKAGPATNMNATPNYLRKGFESSESRALIKEAEKIFRV